MKTILFAALTLLSTELLADCIYNDEYYEVGTVINGYTCTIEGTWVYRSG